MNVCESTKRTKKAKQPAGDKQSRKKRADQVGERVNAEGGGGGRESGIIKRGRSLSWRGARSGCGCQSVVWE